MNDPIELSLAEMLAGDGTVLVSSAVLTVVGPRLDDLAFGDDEVHPSAQ